MAPLTRSRAQADGTPSDLAAEYYAQRAAAGLIITEATAVSETANGAYLNTPGIYTDRHQQRWAEIADAVHAAGGRMFMQLWHVGRMGHPDISGVESVAPSAIAADMTTHTPSGKQAAAGAARAARPTRSPASSSSSAPPRAGPSTPAWTVSRSTPPTAICCTSSCPMWSTSAPTPTADPPENRARLTAEVVEAVVAEIGAGRVGLRISPGNSAGDMREVDDGQRVRGAAGPDRAAGTGLPARADRSRRRPRSRCVRALWDGTLVLNTGRDIDTDFCQLEELADWGVISAAAVGRAFLANPDLIDRLLLGAELNEPDVATFYAPGSRGVRRLPDPGRSWSSSSRVTARSDSTPGVTRTVTRRSRSRETLSTRPTNGLGEAARLAAQRTNLHAGASLRTTQPEQDLEITHVRRSLHLRGHPHAARQAAQRRAERGQARQPGRRPDRRAAHPLPRPGREPDQRRHPRRRLAGRRPGRRHRPHRGAGGRLPDTAGGFQLNRFCASGLEAVNTPRRRCAPAGTTWCSPAASSR